VIMLGQAGNFPMLQQVAAATHGKAYQVTQPGQVAASSITRSGGAAARPTAQPEHPSPASRLSLRGSPQDRRAVLDQLAGAIYDRLGSRLLAGSLGGVAFEPVPVLRPGVRARNRGEGWVMAARKAREGYELGPR
jgi:hypothetical protein